ncbi:ATP-dependent RNA helicase DDX19A-like [Oscarella lobularis]|uniref:ATP-dependent RNA helicase DDX19A-like n=1 Tax=Oscarella lobularis TaxID=121494 RepID=UPI003313818B
MASSDWSKAVEDQEKRLSAGMKRVQLGAPRTAPKTGEATPSAQPSAGDWCDEVDSGPEGEEEGDKPTTAAEASLLNKLLHDGLVKAKVSVEVQQKDPNSPLYSVKSFEQLRLSRELLDGIYGMGFNTPSKIQETALPALIADPPCNMIAQSQSGTGKTAAFVLALLHRVDKTNMWPQVLILSPTYELAVQTGDVISEMARFIPEIKIMLAIKGKKPERGQMIAEQIVVGTPGTVLDFLTRRRCLDPNRIRVFVLDEADIMINVQNFQDHSVRVQRQLKPDCQMMLFSATYSDEVMSFAKRIIPDPIVIRLKKEDETLDNIRQYYTICQKEEEKFVALSNIYGVVTIGQAIVFCYTRKSASALCEKMKNDGHAVALLTGELTLEDRATILTRFRDGKEKLLITTNVCARGIDVEQVTVVFNFDIPVDVYRQPDFETYLHRIGRTGRFGKSGLAINFVDGIRSREYLKRIEDHFGKKIRELRTDDIDEVEKLNEE